jgi:hypothetical protein
MRSLLLLLAVFAISEFTPAAPVPKEILKKFPDYYPLLPGTEWEYEGDGGPAVTLKVTDYANKDGVQTATLKSFVKEKAVASECIRIDQTGVYRTQINNMKIEPPILMFKFGIKDETEWTTNSNVGESKIDVNCKLEGVEEIKVPAGKYQAVKMTGTGMIGDTKSQMTYHYAEGVGIVKMAYSLQDAKTTLSLKKFTAGKADKK